ncbi:NUDIX domain-containing protein [Ruminococcus sp. YE71]|uniref:NUDIX hydrolase n=1 Tax=unclassified Ruminococcus TaxID=2608920 RepID=UPI00087FBF1C|nr:MULTISPECIES: NUDIX domain-containing protein [unclassified Ruminococcus]SDA13936.1 NUDIX domain-containing protein [Ruminococcus sp. YE78]SFW20161.1 NUDIX domain-containing protein [Ruminococcus sp. YE71]
MTEYWDLFDEERRPLGRTVIRGGMDPMSGEYHVVVMIVTMNSRGQVLCTLRSPQKSNYPNVWEFTAGSVFAGEDSLSAAVRELREETGIAVRPEELELLMTVKESTAFIDCYFVRRDAALEELTLQEGETSDARWVSRAEFENLIARRRVAFPVARRYHQLYDYLMQEGFL